MCASSLRPSDGCSCPLPGPLLTLNSPPPKARRGAAEAAYSFSKSRSPKDRGRQESAWQTQERRVGGGPGVGCLASKKPRCRMAFMQCNVFLPVARGWRERWGGPWILSKEQLPEQAPRAACQRERRTGSTCRERWSRQGTPAGLL